MESKLMTDNERADVLMQVIALEEEGKVEEAKALRRTIPIAPFLAKIIKDKLGVEQLIQCDMNLAEAEVAYGTDWLAQ